MNLLRKLLPAPRCNRCRRLRAACICANVARGHVRTAKRAKVDPTPRPCPNPWCSRTMYGGFCSNPDC